VATRASGRPASSAGATAAGGRGAPDTPGPMRLTILGAAAAWSMRAARASSSYLVELHDQALLLDLGQGSFAEVAARLDPASLRAVLISHLHPDHCVDLVPLRHFLKYGRTPPGTVELRGPGELRSRFDALTGEAGFLANLPGPPLAPGTITLGPFEVTIGRVTHVGDSFAFRVAPAGRRGGVVDHVGPGHRASATTIYRPGSDPDPEAGAPGAPGLVYSGDCGRPEDLLPLLRRGDTLLCEASYGPGPVVEGPNHLDSPGAARAARDGGARMLVLTHILDGMDVPATRRAARAVFDGPVVVARPGLTLEVA
jgi:ribonuclease BN (tRNA processing enzyme)